MSKLFVACALALLIFSADAISIKWTGYANNNQWFTPTNWYPDQVPSTGDDVTISSGVVEVPQAAGVNSLVMGDSFSSSANLTIFNDFIIGSGGLNVQGNGNVFVNAGSASITGVVNLDGQLYFQSGSFSGQVTVSSKGVADLSGPAQKVFTACSFVSSGSLTLGGNIVLNQSSQFSVTSTATASGDFAIMNGDGSSVLFDTSAGVLTYLGGGTFSMQAPINLGTFNFNAGNLTIYSDVTFVNPFVIPANSYVSAVGIANVNMTAGVSGQGVLTGSSSQLLLANVNVSGYVNCAGGNVTFGGSSKNVVSGAVTLAGGLLSVNSATEVAMLNLLSGGIVGSVTASKGYIKTTGLNLNGVVSFTGAVTASNSLLAFGQQGSLVFTSGATLSVNGATTFTGVPGRSVTNDGTITASASTDFQNINLQGSGSVNVNAAVTVSTCNIAQSTIAIASGSSFSGSNAQLSIGSITGTSVSAVIGDYKLNCGAQCTNVDTTAPPTSNFKFSA
jgi:hypothetical protein